MPHPRREVNLAGSQEPSSLASWVPQISFGTLRVLSPFDRDTVSRGRAEPVTCITVGTTAVFLSSPAARVSLARRMMLARKSGNTTGARGPQE
jgi:hypothetical protein